MAISTTVVGRMVADPELKTWTSTDGNGNTVTAEYINFKLACDDVQKKDKDGKPRTEFIHVTAWRKAARTLAQYGYKGRNLTVAGNLHLNRYQTGSGIGFCLAIDRPWYFEMLGKNQQVERAVANDDIPEDAPVMIDVPDWIEEP